MSSSEKKPTPDFSPLVEATWLPGPAGALFALVYLPESASHAPAKWVLHLPAFAEEMNKSRAMVANQAREFARQGCAVVVPDLRGTGDSEGDFAQASWQGWREDIEFILGWMREQGAEEVTLWGLRLGGLLALDVATSLPGAASELLLWQPSLVGKTAMTQFLRLRMAAQMMQGGKESVSDMRNQLASGESLEVAGYMVSPQLAAELDAKSAGDMPLPPALRVTLLEVAGEAGKPLLVATRKLVEQWGAGGHTVEAEVVKGEQFWNTQEIATAPALIERSTFLVRCSGLADAAARPMPSSENSLGERVLQFYSEGATLLGVLHRGRPASSKGVLLVVGGPQYRVGSHRQFLLLAKALARNGVPVLRFDYRGMGDSSGSPVDFLGAGADIRAALDCFLRECPSVSKPVIWGLCDAATAGAFYAAEDPRVNGLILLNPWVRSESGESKAYLKHYYLRRLFNRDLWHKIRSGRFEFGKSISALLANIRRVASGFVANQASDDSAAGTLVERMERALKSYSGRAVIILSGDDLTAAEFSDAVKASASFSQLLEQPRFNLESCPLADHTFSRAEWRGEVERISMEFLESL